MAGRFSWIAAAMVPLVLVACLAGAAGVPNAISYQGKLTDSSGVSVPDGNHSMRFKLFDAQTLGTQLWDSGDTSVSTTGGVFTVQLGTTPNPINSATLTTDNVWLETTVGPSTLPRVQLLSSPFALRAADLFGTAQVTSFKLTTSPGAGRVLTSDGSGVGTWQTPSAGSAWALTGNAGTNPATNFIGTTDNQGFEIRVNSSRVLRMDPFDNGTSRSVNVIGGWSGNSVSPGIVGATIAGGGFAQYTGGSWVQHSNTVSGGFGTIGGGESNSSSGPYSAVAGGSRNSANGYMSAIGGGSDNSAGVGQYCTVAGGYWNSSSHWCSTVGGGWRNSAAGQESVVSGGDWNSASGYMSAIGGGTNNTTAGDYSTVAGGYWNSAGGNYSFAAGRQAKADQAGAFVWADSTNADFASTAADQFLIRAAGGVGINKTTPQSALDVAGTATMTGLKMPTSAGSGKVLTSDAAGVGTWQTPSAGSAWTLTGNAGTIPGTNFIGTTDNQPLEFKVNSTRGFRLEPTSGTPHVIGGYSGNTVAAGVVGATISGGGRSGVPNSVTSDYGTVGGGVGNTASDYYATVGGGWDNTAGGQSATVGGGYDNTASGHYSTVGGGWGNAARGHSSTVAGGVFNTALGDYSFAAGTSAKANHHGAFVWADSASPADFASTGDYQFRARAAGGVWFYSNAAATTGVVLNPGDGGWLNASDRSLKANFASIDGKEILAKVAALPMSTWNYKSQDASIRHIGPVAQDFAAAFKFGADDKHISTIDADGVALAAIQGLNDILKEKDVRISTLERKNVELEARLAAIEASLAQTRSGGKGK